MPHERGTRAGILPGCPSLDRQIRMAEVGFEPRTFRSVNSRSNHLDNLAPAICIASDCSSSQSVITKFCPKVNLVCKKHSTDNTNNDRSAVTPFRCLAVMPHEGGTRAGMLPGCSSLYGEVEMQRSGSNHQPSDRAAKTVLSRLVTICGFFYGKTKIPTDQLHTIGQGSKTLICTLFTKTGHPSSPELVFFNFPEYSLTPIIHCSNPIKCYKATPQILQQVSVFKRRKANSQEEKHTARTPPHQ
ncbi:hypothetical protein T265_02009 [Opisthorchis viverrini]|uniref:Uncharacterized protein n=1 Tax=Opisthorchis viverrini TaxID=6198 RepID=A0A074ZWE2_OPIVI|nr:hypothetical protein T265_02009 [Opisthorchis viverrini]KER31773.1 hypothetical protein T265_02009 [Opisthorchis viverrini]